MSRLLTIALTISMLISVTGCVAGENPFYNMGQSAPQDPHYNSPAPSYESPSASLTTQSVSPNMQNYGGSLERFSVSPAPSAPIAATAQPQQPIMVSPVNTAAQPVLMQPVMMQPVPVQPVIMVPVTNNQTPPVIVLPPQTSSPSPVSMNAGNGQPRPDAYNYPVKPYPGNYRPEPAPINGCQRLYSISPYAPTGYACKSPNGTWYVNE